MRKPTEWFEGDVNTGVQLSQREPKELHLKRIQHHTTEGFEGVPQFLLARPHGNAPVHLARNFPGADISLYNFSEEKDITRRHNKEGTRRVSTAREADVSLGIIRTLITYPPKTTPNISAIWYRGVSGGPSIRPPLFREV